MIRAYAAFAAGGELQPFDYDPGELNQNEVEIDVVFCGICHSDLSMVDNEWGISQYPLVPGHEVVGTIAARGENVTNLEVGDTVGLGWHAGYCMTCSNCMQGDHNMCTSAEGTIVGHHGGFADKVRAQAASVIKLPEGIDLDSAGPLFCGGITVFNPLIQFGIKPTDSVAVIGIGGLGHMALQFLNAWGCQVTAFTSSEAKTKEAMELGAHRVINSRDPEALEGAAGQFDLVLSTVNAKMDWNKYIATLKTRGRLHLVGATLEPLDLHLFPMLMGQRSVSASPVGAPANIARMLEFAVRHNIKPIIEKFRFDQVNDALAHLRSGRARYRIVLTK
ncbi:NAD(P)-dependent alcohol dehydrogenase [Desulfopila sp. IMCC35006]|uniref:NADPH-dependent aldehyde reductase Ahr n=1 Tax=Desulfopila sp. IMCC35006 TaxID=2569542 RepID=UPI0010AD6B9C|nr:NAD(P)-dependent alcohol dehydrogenase [Desulfopila sp. IMCC35006]TKB27573.1 NAD(P)-dependent alcohol dehydrogenase [Desulfopila sp. IMCC35006]